MVEETSRRHCGEIKAKPAPSQRSPAFCRELYLPRMAINEKNAVLGWKLTARRHVYELGSLGVRGGMHMKNLRFNCQLVGCLTLWGALAGAATAGASTPAKPAAAAAAKPGAATTGTKPAKAPPAPD